MSPEPEGNDPDRAAWAELFELAPPEEDEEQPRRRGLFARLKENLTAPRQTISPQLAGIFAPALVSAETWDDLEEALSRPTAAWTPAWRWWRSCGPSPSRAASPSGADLSRALWRAVAEQMAPEPRASR